MLNEHYKGLSDESIATALTILAERKGTPYEFNSKTIAGWKKINR